MSLDLIRHFQRFDGHGNGFIIKGRVRVGKTYFASILVKLLLKKGFAVISNIRFRTDVYDEYAGKLFYIQDDVGYFQAYVTIADSTPIVLAWDDAQAQEGMKSTGVMSTQGKKLASFLIFIGKFQSNYIFIAHQKYIPNSITEGFDPLIAYKFVRTGFILSDTLYENDRDVYNDPNAIHVPIPPPAEGHHLPIQSRAIAGFKFNLDLPALYDHLGQFHVGENLKHGVKEFLETRDAGDGKYSELKSWAFKDIYIALCMKKGKIISDGEKLRDLINPSVINDARKILKSMGLNK